MKQVRAFARGLQQLLGSIEQGRGIELLEDALRATIDVTQFVGAANRRFHSGASLNPPSGGLQVSGPSASPATQNQTWRVLCFGATISCDATGTINGAFLQYNRLGSTDGMALTSSITLGVNNGGSLVYAPPEPLLIVPGDMLIIASNSAPVANAQWRWGVLYDLVAPIA